MCTDGLNLRFAWYAQATVLQVNSRAVNGGGRAVLEAGQWGVMMLDRDREGYRAALAAYREHLKACEVCRMWSVQ